MPPLPRCEPNIVDSTAVEHGDEVDHLDHRTRDLCGCRARCAAGEAHPSDRIARSAKLAGAVALDRDAAAYGDQAAEEIGSGAAQRSAAANREKARQRLADGLDEANARERQGKQRATAQARADATRDKQQAAARTKQRTGAIQQGLQKADAVTDVKLQQTRRGANAKLDQARATKTAANSARARADQLGQLAATKRNSRNERHNSTG